MHTEKVQIQVDGSPMSAYLAAPQGGGPYPAVIVYEEIFGVNAHIRSVVDRVAKEGYVAIAPHIHHRAAPELELDYTPEGMQKGFPLISKLTEAGAFADINSTIDYLRTREDVRKDLIGCMGFCIGGHMAYLTACTTDVRATASFYGGGVAVMGLGVKDPTVTRTEGIKGKIICFFGAKDSAIPLDQVETIKRALEQQHIRHEVVVYPDASHAFFRDVDPTKYVPTAAADAWERTKRLFAEELK